MDLIFPLFRVIIIFVFQNEYSQNPLSQVKYQTGKLFNLYLLLKEGVIKSVSKKNCWKSIRKKGGLNLNHIRSWETWPSSSIIGMLNLNCRFKSLIRVSSSPTVQTKENERTKSPRITRVKAREIAKSRVTKRKNKKNKGSQRTITTNKTSIAPKPIASEEFVFRQVQGG